MTAPVLDPPAEGPRLRVVPEGATHSDLQRELTWDEWSQQFLDGAPSPVRSVTPAVAHVAPGVTAHGATTSTSRAAAYSRVPNAPSITNRAPVTTVRAQRARRRQILFALGGAAIMSSLLALVTGFALLDYLAFVSWVGLLGFLGLMYYAMTTGLIESAGSRSVRLVNPRTADELEPVVVFNEFDLAYDPQDASQFRRDAELRYAQAL